MTIDSDYPVEDYTNSSRDGKTYRLTFQRGACAPVLEMVKEPMQAFLYTDRIFFLPNDDSITQLENGVLALL